MGVVSGFAMASNCTWSGLLISDWATPVTISLTYAAPPRYIEVFYNRTCPHSHLGISTETFE